MLVICQCAVHRSHSLIVKAATTLWMEYVRLKAGGAGRLKPPQKYSAVTIPYITRLVTIGKATREHVIARYRILQ